MIQAKSTTGTIKMTTYVVIRYHKNIRIPRIQTVNKHNSVIPMQEQYLTVTENNVKMNSDLSFPEPKEISTFSREPNRREMEKD